MYAETACRAYFERGKPLLEATAHKQSSATGLASQVTSLASVSCEVSILGPWPLRSDPLTDLSPAALEHTPAVSAGPGLVAPKPHEKWAQPPAPGEESSPNGTRTETPTPSIPVRSSVPSGGGLWLDAPCRDLATFSLNHFLS